MKNSFSIIAIALLLFAPAVSPASSCAPGELLVKYRPGRYPLHLKKGVLAKIGWAKIGIDSHKGMAREMERVKSEPDIVAVEPNYYGEFLAEPNDPRLSEQLYLTAIKVPQAWGKSLGRGVIIGLVDSGVALDHEDLAGNLLDGWDFGDNDDDPHDQLGHGTMVCGVIAAVQNNGLGISGVAPQSKVLPVKISRGTTDLFTDETVGEAILYAADRGAAIINLSLGWNDAEAHQLVTDAITYAVEQRGVTVVAAAGNARGSVWFPARLESVISVSAVNGNDQNLNSAYGEELDLVAPGSVSTTDDFILTTSREYPYYTFSKGTSLSAAMVSGIAALLLSEQPHLTARQAAAYLTNRADDLGEPGRDDLFGYGKVNALATLDPLISFVFPSKLVGSRTLPMVYLLAFFGYDTHFIPLSTRVWFESEHLVSLGPPVFTFPKALLQLVMLKRDPEAGFVDVTITSGTETIAGYDAVRIGMPGMAMGKVRETTIQTN